MKKVNDYDSDLLVMIVAVMMMMTLTGIVRKVSDSDTTVVMVVSTGIVKEVSTGIVSMVMVSRVSHYGGGGSNGDGDWWLW